MIAVDGREARLDLRLVPAALTSWAVTAAGILWSLTGVVAVVAIASLVAGAAAWWGCRRRRADVDARMTAAGFAAIALVGLGFAVAVLLRVEQVRDHPLTARYGTVVGVVVTPSESPRSVRGGRLMFRGSLQAVDTVEMSGQVVVFASTGGFADLTSGPTGSVQGARLAAGQTRSHGRCAVGDRPADARRSRTDPAGGATRARHVRHRGACRTADRSGGDAARPGSR